MSFFKKKTPQEKKKPLPGGQNPYLDARRTWNEHTGSVVAQRQMWQVAALMSMTVALAATGGMIHTAQQSRFVPYVVEVDKLGQAATAHVVQRAAPVDQRVVHSMLASFIQDARMVTVDVPLQRSAILRVFSKIPDGSAARQKMTEWYSGSKENSPFKRAETELVSVQIVSVIPQSESTWQVDWVEEVRTPTDGTQKAPPQRMRALLVVEISPPTARTTEEEIRRNPLGLFVKDFNWSKQI